MAGFPPAAGPSRLASRWSLGGPTSDSDGTFRPAFENVRRPRFTVVGVGLYSYPSVMIRRCPLVLPLEPLAKELLARTILVVMVQTLTCLPLEQIPMARTLSSVTFMRLSVSNRWIIQLLTLCSGLWRTSYYPIYKCANGTMCAFLVLFLTISFSPNLSLGKVLRQLPFCNKSDGQCVIFSYACDLCRPCR